MIEKPSESEEEYFARQEYERRKQVEEEKQKKLAVEEKNKLKDLHYMRCPKCGMQLVEMEYKGLRIDRCSSCDGVWLDAGELEAVSELEHSGMKKFFSVFKKG